MKNPFRNSKSEAKFSIFGCILDSDHVMKDMKISIHYIRACLFQKQKDLFVKNDENNYD